MIIQLYGFAVMFTALHHSVFWYKMSIFWVLSTKKIKSILARQYTKARLSPIYFYFVILYLENIQKIMKNHILENEMPFLLVLCFTY